MTTNNLETLSVSSLSTKVKYLLEERFGRIRVHGEITQLKRSAPGHLYFSLIEEKKDSYKNNYAGAKVYTIGAICWGSTARTLSLQPEDGLSVFATGRVTTYAHGRSSYQLIVDKLEHDSAGSYLEHLRRLKERLLKEGLFDKGHKRPLPRFPKCIGLITSSQGAVLQDIRHRLAERYVERILLCPSAVQGEAALSDILRALARFGRMTGPERPDVLILARGGGSAEDLMVFNHEDLVRALHKFKLASQIPIISAIGHETDTSLCDFVCDVRAPTPTAAAEIVAPLRETLRVDVDAWLTQCRQVGRARLDVRRDKLHLLRPPSLRRRFEQNRQHIETLLIGVRRHTSTRVKQDRLALETLSERQRRAPVLAPYERALEALVLPRDRWLQHLRARSGELRTLGQQAANHLRRGVARRREQVAASFQLARSVSPEPTLERGYSVLLDPHQRVIASPEQLRDHESVEALFARGQRAVLKPLLESGPQLGPQLGEPTGPPSTRSRKKQQTTEPPPQGALF